MGRKEAAEGSEEGRVGLQIEWQWAAGPWREVTLRWNTPLSLTGAWRGCRGQRHVQSTGACQEAEGRPPGRRGGHRAKSTSERAGEVRPTGRDRSRGPTKRGGDVVSEPRSHVT